MKLKLFAFLFFVAVTLNVSIAQENGNEQEGENFWTEEGSEAAAQDSTDKNDSGEFGVEDEGSSDDVDQPKVKEVKNSCSNRSELREEARLLLRPFRYNLAKTSMIIMKRYPQKRIMVIPIYAHQSHRLVFSSRGMPQPYGIKVYDRHPEAEAKKAQVLFEGNKEEFINTYELPENYGNQYIFVEYDIPASDAGNRDYTIKGCAIMFMGYLYVTDGEDESTVNTDSEEASTEDSE